VREGITRAPFVQEKPELQRGTGCGPKNKRAKNRLHPESGKSRRRGKADQVPWQARLEAVVGGYKKGKKRPKQETQKR